MLESWFHSVFPDNTLMPVIKLSQTHGVEVHSPYADAELIDFVTKIPGELTIREDETEYLMKQLALRYLPEVMIFREKEYYIPLLLSLAEHSEAYLRNLLSTERLNAHGFFQPDVVQGLIETVHSNSKLKRVKPRNHTHKLIFALNI
jgi:asparagine synthase (glutamine-hydrolysing)